MLSATRIPFAVTCCLFILTAAASAQTSKPDVIFDVPDKDRVSMQPDDLLMQLVRLSGTGGGLAWRSSVLGKEVKAEGLAWSGRILMHGSEIRIKGVKFTKEDEGRPVRVVGVLRYDQGTWSRFGSVPPYFYLHSDSYEVIDRVKAPALVCNDKDVPPIKILTQSKAKEKPAESK